VAQVESRAVVFVTDRAGPALRRREHCLGLAGIACVLESERRPSGVYYKLCVADADAVAAHLALAMGGCARPPRLRQPVTPALTDTLGEVAGMLRDEAVIAAGRLVDAVRAAAPRLLASLRDDRG
jgi:hypothetical protein